MRTQRNALRWLGVCLVIALAGCVNAPPKLEPPKQADVLRVPPLNARYNNSYYPRQAMPKRDGGRRLFSEMPNPRGPQMPNSPGSLGNRAF